ncbi:MAG: choline/ethanolamine kinase family protein [Actinomycetota bacterium]|nr:choline/ethanolamine kinase family protein [Actinomycetota bacterium]
MHDATLERVLSHVPEIRGGEDLSVSPLLGGLTNRNYRVATDGREYVVRIAGRNDDLLGIDREREVRILRGASAAGMAPEVVAVCLPEGHLVTRFLGDAQSFTLEEFHSTEMVPRIAARLRDVHDLPPVQGNFDPYDDIRRWRETILKRNTPLPRRLDSIIERVERTEPLRARALEGKKVLCHNDPYYLNWLDDGTLWIIDWEYAGMGDPFYDLAAVAYRSEEDDRDLLLRSYFGEVDPDSRGVLSEMIAVFLCWNVLWCLLQIGMSEVDYDYQALAGEFLDLV